MATWYVLSYRFFSGGRRGTVRAPSWSEAVARATRLTGDSAVRLEFDRVDSFDNQEQAHAYTESDAAGGERPGAGPPEGDGGAE
jgi:hypothetical protein